MALFLRAVGRIEQDDREFRRVWSQDQSPSIFESQRRNYVMRQELGGLSISADETVSPRLAGWLEKLGVAIIR